MRLILVFVIGLLLPALAHAQCPAGAPQNSLPCQPSLGAAQTNDLIQAYRPSLYPHGTGSLSVQNAIPQSFISAHCITFSSTTAVTAQTFEFPGEWSTYTISSVMTATHGSGSFTAALNINGVAVTGCTVTVSGTTSTETECSAANVGVAGDQITVVISAISGTVNQAYVCPKFTHPAL